eukprot:30017-Pelagococcus_subviridis.AAC.33
MGETRLYRTHLMQIFRPGREQQQTPDRGEHDLVDVAAVPEHELTAVEARAGGVEVQHRAVVVARDVRLVHVRGVGVVRVGVPLRVELSSSSSASASASAPPPRRQPRQQRPGEVHAPRLRELDLDRAPRPAAQRVDDVRGPRPAPRGERGEVVRRQRALAVDDVETFHGDDRGAARVPALAIARETVEDDARRSDQRGGTRVASASATAGGGADGAVHSLRFIPRDASPSRPMIFARSSFATARGSTPPSVSVICRRRRPVPAAVAATKARCTACALRNAATPSLSPARGASFFRPLAAGLYPSVASSDGAPPRSAAATFRRASLSRSRTYVSLHARDSAVSLPRDDNSATPPARVHIISARARTRASDDELDAASSDVDVDEDAGVSAAVTVRTLVFFDHRTPTASSSSPRASSGSGTTSSEPPARTTTRHDSTLGGAVVAVDAGSFESVPGDRSELVRALPRSTKTSHSDAALASVCTVMTHLAVGPPKSRYATSCAIEGGSRAIAPPPPPRWVPTVYAGAVDKIFGAKERERRVASFGPFGAERSAAHVFWAGEPRAPIARVPHTLARESAPRDRLGPREVEGGRARGRRGHRGVGRRGDAPPREGSLAVKFSSGRELTAP